MDVGKDEVRAKATAAPTTANFLPDHPPVVPVEAVDAVDAAAGVKARKGVACAPAALMVPEAVAVGKAVRKDVTAGAAALAIPKDSVARMDDVVGKTMTTQRAVLVDLTVAVDRRAGVATKGSRAVLDVDGADPAGLTPKSCSA